MVRIRSAIVRYVKDCIKNEKNLFICARSIKEYLGKSNLDLFTIEERLFVALLCDKVICHVSNPLVSVCREFSEYLSIIPDSIIKMSSNKDGFSKS